MDYITRSCYTQWESAVGIFCLYLYINMRRNKTLTHLMKSLRCFNLSPSRAPFLHMIIQTESFSPWQIENTDHVLNWWSAPWGTPSTEVKWKLVQERVHCRQFWYQPQPNMCHGCQHVSSHLIQMCKLSRQEEGKRHLFFFFLIAPTHLMTAILFPRLPVSTDF